MRKPCFIIGLATQIHCATKPPRGYGPEAFGTEDGNCADLSTGDLPPNTYCLDYGTFQGTNPWYQDYQAASCTTQDQCIDKCWAEEFKCYGYAWDATNKQCYFYGDTLYNSGFTPTANSSMDIRYSDRICWTCKCCRGVANQALCDKGRFEFPFGNPDSSPWMLFPISPPPYPSPGGNSVLHPGTFLMNCHSDTLMTGPPLFQGKNRATIAQYVHLCQKKQRYVVDFDYRFEAPSTGLQHANIQMYAGGYSSPSGFSSLPLFPPLFSANIGSAIGAPNKWYHYRTCAFTVPSGQVGYIQFDGFSTGATQGFRIDNVVITCANKTDKPCKRPKLTVLG